MSTLYSVIPVSPKPRNYVTPPFPSLYQPFPIDVAPAQYLYNANDIWRFTLYWTLLCYGAIHMASSGYAVLTQLKSWRVIWLVPLIYAVVGAVEAVIAGSIVGGLLGAIYNAGNFRMSTWIPFIWAIINSLILISSSFAIQGGL